MRVKSPILLVTLLLGFLLTSCSSKSSDKQANIDTQPTNTNNKSVELYLPQLKDFYNSVYDHWAELKLDNISLMDKPLLTSNDIASIGNEEVKTKKNFIVVNGSGMDTGLIFDDKKERVLEFKYNGKDYKINSKSPNIFCNYTVHGVCVVLEDDKIFLVRQREYNKPVKTLSNYKKGIIGIPYVLVIDGKRTELGILKVGDGEFAVPQMVDSWCYMGFPEGLSELSPNGTILKRLANLSNLTTDQPLEGSTKSSVLGGVFIEE